LKPWIEFFSTSRFKKPIGVAQASTRLIKNIEYFQSNYLFVFIGLAVYCMLVFFELTFIS
jgi:anoctamin-1